MDVQNLPLYNKYAARIEASKSEADVRQVLRAATTDPKMYHAILHELNAAARVRVATFAAPARSPARPRKDAGKDGGA
ncbi:MAG: hypothetical protein LBR05_01075 [Azoarcus sp.]|jgi:hypothetical protein|nr:hypothetical protein [Azoarcus sp.]